MTPKRGGVEVRTVETPRSTPRTRSAGVETQGGYGGEFSTLHTTPATDADLLAQARRIASLAADIRAVQSLTPEKVNRLAAMLDSADDETALEGVVAIFDLLDRMERVCP